MGLKSHRPDTMLIQLHYYSKPSLQKLALCLRDSQELHFRRMRRIKSKKISTKKELYRRVLTGRDYIAQNLQKQVHMEEAARAASLSPFHFHRTFTDVFGLSPARFARQLKIERARRLLNGGQYKIKEVAAQLGYADGFSFSKAFKRETGMAPIEFLNG